MAYVLGKGNEDQLIEALAPYQNNDGGFGHAIEPDFRVPDSSVTATTVAFQTIIACNLASDLPLVQRAIDYLLATYDPTAQSWPPTCEAIMDYPRARWWNNYPPIVYKPDDGDWANPNIEVVGIFNRYPDRVDAKLLTQLNQLAQDWLKANTTAEPHSILCAMRYVDSLQGEQHAAAELELIRLAQSVVKHDPAAWEEYGPQPIWFAQQPNTPLADAMGPSLHDNLAFLIKHQHPDGSWQPTWEWGRYEDDWPTAKQEWAGYITVSNLRLLSNFGLLNNYS